MIRPILPLLAALSLAACDAQIVSLNRFLPAEETGPIGPPDAVPGACYSQPDGATEIAPIRTRVLVKPARVNADGVILDPPVYRTDTSTDTLEHDAVEWFETPCPPVFTPEFIASLQRAMKARDYYRGPITSVMDDQTQSAIRRIQKEAGLNSAVLSLETARKLGLIVVPTEVDS